MDGFMFNRSTVSMYSIERSECEPIKLHKWHVLLNTVSKQNRFQAATFDHNTILYTLDD